MRSVTDRTRACTLASMLALGLGFLFAGCKPDPYRPDAGPKGPPWWTPEPGEILDWDIQLAGTPFDVSTTRAMYAIDLFDAVPAETMLDYGDGMPVTVPAGAHAAAIAQLHATSPPTIVVCHVSTGTIRLDDPDASKFPGFQTTPADPPDNPTTPEPGSVIGWSLAGGDPKERFLDVTGGGRDTVLPIVERRLQLAKQIGCDAVAAARNDAVVYPGQTGFADVTRDEHQAWSSGLTGRAHDRELSIGVRAPPQVVVDISVPLYDWAIVERCGEYDECDMFRGFLNAREAVFGVEYDLDENGDPNPMSLVCDHLANAGIAGAIVKTAALDSSYRMACP